MDIIEIINKKRMGKILSEKELEFVISGYLDGSIYDYQMSSLLMAIVLKGMTNKEIVNLTRLMLESGERLDLSGLGNAVDKHSTGGVGDKTTMIVGPMVAACGVNVAKMSGKGLGHTGGTIDKLESIPGFRVNISTEDFVRQVKEIGLAVVSQTNNLVPADKKIYALRDVTGTVESIPLIASSIMSKKIASGAKKLVIDVKIGTGALIKNIKDARKLSKLMIEIGKSNEMEVVCLLTNMDIPLGSNIGNALEVREAIDVLKNKKQGNLLDLCVELASYMVSLGLGIDYEDAKSKVIINLENGNAYRKFEEFVKWQKGDLKELPEAKNTYEVRASKDGYLNSIDALTLGKLSMHLGAGRMNLSDELDYGAGIVVLKNVGDYINKGDVLMRLHTSKELDMKDNYEEAFLIEKKKREDLVLIYEVIK